MHTFTKSSLPGKPTALTYAVSPDQAQHMLRIIERWQQNNKNSFLYEFSLLIDGVLRAVVCVPAEIQNERIEWQKNLEEHLGLLQSNVVALIENLRAEGDALTQHWDYATQERNEAHVLARQVFDGLHNSVEEFTRREREREARSCSQLT